MMFYPKMVLKKASFIKDLHNHIKLQIEKKVGKYAENANKRRKALVFEIGDWVWLYLRKDRFPIQRKFKLMPRGDGPFQVIKRINDNAYELHMSDTFLGSHIFNISDLTPFSVGLQNSWSNSLQLGEHDGDQVEEENEAQVQDSQRQISSSSFISQRITRSKAKVLGNRVQMFSLFVITVEPSDVQALKNPNPFKDVEGWLCLLLLNYLR